MESIKVELDIGGEPFSFSRQRISKEEWLSLDPYQYKKVKNEEFPEIKEGQTTKAKVASEENILENMLKVKK